MTSLIQLIFSNCTHIHKTSFSFSNDRYLLYFFCNQLSHTAVRTYKHSSAIVRFYLENNYKLNPNKTKRNEKSSAGRTEGKNHEIRVPRERVASGLAVGSRRRPMLMTRVAGQMQEFDRKTSKRQHADTNLHFYVARTRVRTQSVVRSLTASPLCCYYFPLSTNEKKKKNITIVWRNVTRILFATKHIALVLFL